MSHLLIIKIVVVTVAAVVLFTTHIEGFHCHTIIKTIQQIKSRIKEKRKKKMNIQTVSQRFRSVRFFVREIFEEMFCSNL